MPCVLHLKLLTLARATSLRDPSDHPFVKVNSAFLVRIGFKGTGYKDLSFAELLNLPSPIVPIDFYGNAHFVVVRGLDPAGRVKLADPGFGNTSMPVDDFQSIWKGGMGFVVSR